ncbi:MAG: hypothetical protein LBI26_03190 [Holosporales bacterium]|jgi:hypothetical protein|nr:hypothetical protein [Holosporales bacterium]
MFFSLINREFSLFGFVLFLQFCIAPDCNSSVFKVSFDKEYELDPEAHFDIKISSDQIKVAKGLHDCLLETQKRRPLDVGPTLYKLIEGKMTIQYRDGSILYSGNDPSQRISDQIDHLGDHLCDDGHFGKGPGIKPIAGAANPSRFNTESTIDDRTKAKRICKDIMELSLCSGRVSFEVSDVGGYRPNQFFLFANLHGHAIKGLKDHPGSYVLGGKAGTNPADTDYIKFTVASYLKSKAGDLYSGIQCIMVTFFPDAQDLPTKSSSNSSLSSNITRTSKLLPVQSQFEHIIGLWNGLSKSTKIAGMLSFLALILCNIEIGYSSCWGLRS